MKGGVDDAMYDAKRCLEDAKDSLEQAEDHVDYALDEGLDSVYDRGHGGRTMGDMFWLLSYIALGSFFIPILQHDVTGCAGCGASLASFVDFDELDAFSSALVTTP